MIRELQEDGVLFRWPGGSSVHMSKDLHSHQHFLNMIIAQINLNLFRLSKSTYKIIFADVDFS